MAAEEAEQGQRSRHIVGFRFVDFRLHVRLPPVLTGTPAATYSRDIGTIDSEGGRPPSTLPPRAPEQVRLGDQGDVTQRAIGGDDLDGLHVISGQR